MSKADVLARLRAQKVIALIRADNADNLIGCGSKQAFKLAS